MTSPWLWSIGPGQAAPTPQDPLPGMPRSASSAESRLGGLGDKRLRVEARLDLLAGVGQLLPGHVDHDHGHLERVEVDTYGVGGRRVDA